MFCRGKLVQTHPAEQTIPPHGVINGSRLQWCWAYCRWRGNGCPSEPENPKFPTHTAAMQAVLFSFLKLCGEAGLRQTGEKLGRAPEVHEWTPEGRNILPQSTGFLRRGSERTPGSTLRLVTSLSNSCYHLPFSLNEDQANEGDLLLRGQWCDRSQTTLSVPLTYFVILLSIYWVCCSELNPAISSRVKPAGNHSFCGIFCLGTITMYLF